MAFCTQTTPHLTLAAAAAHLPTGRCQVIEQPKMPDSGRLRGAHDIHTGALRRASVRVRHAVSTAHRQVNRRAGLRAAIPHRALRRETLAHADPRHAVVRARAIALAARRHAAVPEGGAALVRARALRVLRARRPCKVFARVAGLAGAGGVDHSRRVRDALHPGRALLEEPGQRVTAALGARLREGHALPTDQAVAVRLARNVLRRPAPAATRFQSHHTGSAAPGGWSLAIGARGSRCRHRTASPHHRSPQPARYATGRRPARRACKARHRHSRCSRPPRKRGRGRWCTAAPTHTDPAGHNEELRRSQNKTDTSPHFA